MAEPAAVARLVALLQARDRSASAAARQLHDTIGPTLMAIGYQLSALKLPGDQTAELRTLLESAMTGVRDLSNALHASAVERSGLAMALERLIEDARAKTRATVTLQVKNEKRFPPNTANAVFRIVELALDNAVQHAEASRIDIRVDAVAAGLSAEIRDDGAGFDAAHARKAPRGIGLLLARAIAADEKLSVQLESAPGKGTIIKIQTAES
jgi:signal transduction histidine kinase